MTKIDSIPSGSVPQRFRYCTDASETNCWHSAYPQSIASETTDWIQFAYHCPRCNKHWTMGWAKDAAKEHSRGMHDELLEIGTKYINDLTDRRKVAV